MPAFSEDGRAKVNLTLRVFGRRGDGYHDIESVVAFADCADHLTLTEAPVLDLGATGPLAVSGADAIDSWANEGADPVPSRVGGCSWGAAPVGAETFGYPGGST